MLVEAGGRLVPSAGAALGPGAEPVDESVGRVGGDGGATRPEVSPERTIDDVTLAIQRGPVAQRILGPLQRGSVAGQPFLAVGEVLRVTLDGVPGLVEGHPRPVELDTMRRNGRSSSIRTWSLHFRWLTLL
ncbi:MAG: hypothetical protein ACRD2W_09305 [Acidimicrobiales bacterium]